MTLRARRVSETVAPQPPPRVMKRGMRRLSNALSLSPLRGGQGGPNSAGTKKWQSENERNAYSDWSLLRDHQQGLGVCLEDLPEFGGRCSC